MLESFRNLYSRRNIEKEEVDFDVLHEGALYTEIKKGSKWEARYFRLVLLRSPHPEPGVWFWWHDPEENRKKYNLTPPASPPSANNRKKLRHLVEEEEKMCKTPCFIVSRQCLRDQMDDLASEASFFLLKPSPQSKCGDEGYPYVFGVSTPSLQRDREELPSSSLPPSPMISSSNSALENVPPLSSEKASKMPFQIPFFGSSKAKVDQSAVDTEADPTETDDQAESSSTVSPNSSNAKAETSFRSKPAGVLGKQSELLVAAASIPEREMWRESLKNLGILDASAVLECRTRDFLAGKQLQRLPPAPRRFRSWKRDMAINTGHYVGSKGLDYFTGGLFSPIYKVAKLGAVGAAIPLDPEVVSTLQWMMARTGWTTSKISNALFDAVTYAYENVGSHKRVFAHLLEQHPGEEECSPELLSSLRPFHTASVSSYREHKSEAAAHMKHLGYETLLAVSSSRPEQPAFCMFVHPRRKVAYVAIRGSKSIADWITNLRVVPKRVFFPALQQENNGDAWKQEQARFVMSHGAFHQAAKWLADIVLEPCQKLQEAGFEIAVTGHSYGGAVAVLLGVMLLPYMKKRNKIKVVSFCAPPMADSNLAEWLRSQAPADFLTGVVYGLDVVPRLSLGVIKKFQGRELRQLDQAICSAQHARRIEEERVFLEGVVDGEEEMVKPVRGLQDEKNKTADAILPMQVEMKDMGTTSTPNGELEEKKNLRKRKASKGILDREGLGKEGRGEKSSPNLELASKVDKDVAKDESDDLVFPGRVVYLERREDTTIKPHLLLDGMHPVLRFLPMSSQSMLKHHHIRNVGEALAEAVEYAREAQL